MGYQGGTSEEYVGRAMRDFARTKEWATFTSVQGHYNLIFREEEREMAPYCAGENIAMTPYSALAAAESGGLYLKKHFAEGNRNIALCNFIFRDCSLKQPSKGPC